MDYNIEGLLHQGSLSEPHQMVICAAVKTVRTPVDAWNWRTHFDEMSIYRYPN